MVALWSHTPHLDVKTYDFLEELYESTFNVMIKCKEKHCPMFLLLCVADHLPLCNKILKPHLIFPFGQYVRKICAIRCRHIQLLLFSTIALRERFVNKCCHDKVVFNL